MRNEDAMAVGRLQHAVDALEVAAFDAVLTSKHHMEPDHPIARHVTRELMQIRNRVAALQGGSQFTLGLDDVGMSSLPDRLSTGGEALAQLERMAWTPSSVIA